MSFWWNKRKGNRQFVYSISGAVGIILYTVFFVLALIVMSLSSRN